MLVVAVGFFHLLEMNSANFFLRLRRFFHRWIEQDEILVFRFSLGQPVGAALAEPAVGDRQFGLGKKFAGVVGIDEGLQRQSSHFKATALDIANCLVVEHLVGLLRVLGDRIFVFALGATYRKCEKCREQREHTQANYVGKAHQGTS